MKICPKCSGTQSCRWHTNDVCHRCYSKQKKAEIDADPMRKSRHLANARKRSRSPSVRFASAKRTAVKRGVTWDLTRLQFDLLNKFPCFYCFSKLPSVGVGLDRLDNSFGYRAGNVVPCCSQCNWIRGDNLSVEEMRTAMEAVLKLRRDQGNFTFDEEAFQELRKIV